MRGFSVALVLVAAAILLPGTAQATRILGDETRIELTGDLHGAALGLFFPASLSPDGEVVLPVVGGNIDLATLEGQVNHAGALSFAGVGGSVNLADLIFDLTAGIVFGDLQFQPAAGSSVEVSGLPLFQLRSCFLTRLSEPCFDAQGDQLIDGWGMDWAGSATQFMNDAISPFPAPLVFLEGDAFGVARFDLTLPEPALPLLFFTGLVALGRRKPRHASSGGGS